MTMSDALSDTMNDYVSDQPMAVADPPEPQKDLVLSKDEQKKADDASDKKRQKIAQTIEDTGKDIGKTLSAPNPAQPNPPQVNMPQQMAIPQMQPMAARTIQQAPAFMPQQIPVQPQPMPQLRPQQPQQMGYQNPLYSDEDLKDNVDDTSDMDIDQFVKHISKPISYDYKDPQDGTHTEGGLLAQDLQKSKIGKSVVMNTPRGLAVDTNKMTPIIAAVFSKKITDLESKIKDVLDSKFKKDK